MFRHCLAGSIIAHLLVLTGIGIAIPSHRAIVTPQPEPNFQMYTESDEETGSGLDNGFIETGSTKAWILKHAGKETGVGTGSSMQGKRFSHTNVSGESSNPVPAPPPISTNVSAVASQKLPLIVGESVSNVRETTQAAERFSGKENGEAVSEKTHVSSSGMGENLPPHSFSKTGGVTNSDTIPGTTGKERGGVGKIGGSGGGMGPDSGGTGSRGTVEGMADPDLPVVDEAPFKLYSPGPAYPTKARNNNWEGRVILLVEVMADGKVGQIRIEHSSGYELLDKAAIESVKRWRYRPARSGGVAVNCLKRIPINFHLEE